MRCIRVDRLADERLDRHAQLITGEAWAAPPAESRDGARVMRLAQGGAIGVRAPAAARVTRDDGCPFANSSRSAVASPVRAYSRMRTACSTRPRSEERRVGKECST